MVLARGVEAVATDEAKELKRDEEAGAVDAVEEGEEEEGGGDEREVSVPLVADVEVFEWDSCDVNMGVV